MATAKNAAQEVVEKIKAAREKASKAATSGDESAMRRALSCKSDLASAERIAKRWVAGLYD